MAFLRGPRLRTKLMLLGLALLIVPWFSYRQLVEMEAFLVNGQSQAQLLTAEGIATLLNGRSDLFNDLPLSLEDYASLYAHPLPGRIQIDGRAADWQSLLDRSRRFSSSDDGSRDGAFNVVLGERGGQLYAHVRVFDAEHVYRNPDYLRLDNSDHLRVSFTHHDGRDGRLLLTFTAPGLITAYHMNSDWRLAETGQPENRVIGAVEALEDGYSIEFRLPLDMLGTHRHFGLAFADVDDEQTREIRAITQTLPKAGEESFNLVVLRSPEVLKVISGLGYSGARIIVVDAQKRVRAETGAYQAQPSVSPSADATPRWLDRFAPMVRWLIDAALRGPVIVTNANQISDNVIASSLNNKPTALRRYFPNGEESIMAAHPIIARDEVIGAVIVEQNTDRILAIQRQALERIALVSVLSLLAVFVLLVAFSVRLAWRIRNLGNETSNAIDPRGRLRTAQIHSETNSGDEIGDLARSISGMLSRLHQHNQFLENMPRTLRHEINNPLNTLMTSIQNLEAAVPDVANSKYLDSAKRGAMRIGSIIQNLADAASLEESLTSEDLEIIDINELLGNYVNNCALMHPGCEFVYRGTDRPVHANVADYRIEQLLDKIIDNAIDFHRKDTPIRVRLDVEREHLVISVVNSGPPLDSTMQDALFDSMVSHRSDMSDNKLHFGLGLYVVRVIAEHHNGSVSAHNLEDGSGVAISVRLPLAEVAPRTPREGWGPARTGNMPRLRLDGAAS